MGTWQRHTVSIHEATIELGGKVVRMEAGNPAKAGLAISGKSDADTYAKPAPARNVVAITPLGRGEKSGVQEEEIPGTPFVKGENDKGPVSPNDVRQGDLGDCYFIAALAGMAAQHPDIVERSIITDDQGRHWVRMYDGDTHLPMWVMTGQDFPVRDGRIIYAQPGDGTQDEHGKKGHELWPMLFEKAFASRTASKCSNRTTLNGYAAIGRGGPLDRGLFTVTGQKPTNFDLKTVTIEDLSDRISRGEVVLVATVGQPNALPRPPPRDKLLGRHAYYVQSVDVKAKILTVQNPHGWRTDPIVVPFDRVPLAFDSMASSSPGVASSPPSGFRPRKFTR